LLPVWFTVAPTAPEYSYFKGRPAQNAGWTAAGDDGDQNIRIPQFLSDGFLNTVPEGDGNFIQKNDCQTPPERLVEHVGKLLGNRIILVGIADKYFKFFHFVSLLEFFVLWMAAPISYIEFTFTDPSLYG
jgi:hypothetical protein